MLTTVYLALGSNVGDTQQNIQQAIALLGEHVAITGQAPLYQTKAVGYEAQADFVNTVIGGRTPFSPRSLLEFVKKIEQQVGRVERFRWGPREIDIDIIFYGDETVRENGLTIPHPHYAERDFVLRPLSDIAAGLVDPATGRTIEQLLRALLPEQQSVIRRLP